MFLCLDRKVEPNNTVHVWLRIEFIHTIFHFPFYFHHCFLYLLFHNHLQVCHHKDSHGLLFCFVIISACPETVNISNTVDIITYAIILFAVDRNSNTLTLISLLYANTTQPYLIAQKWHDKLSQNLG